MNLILDYPLQGSFLAEYKAKNNYVLFVHSNIWGLGIYFTSLFLGLFTLNSINDYILNLSILIMLIFGHMLIDYIKCRRKYRIYKPEKYDELDYKTYYIDQFLHAFQVYIVCLISFLYY
jgi:hypothetical protein